MLTRSKPLHQQVEEFVRGQIASGEFVPGSRLPSTSALAKMTGASVFTVQTALVRLYREGLLDRQANRATYVKGEKPALTCAGVYFNRPFARADSAFYQVLGQELRQRLNKEGVKVHALIDEREEAEQSEPVASLKRAMEKREIQALIAPLICGNDLKWLQEAPVPTALLTTDLSIQNRVSGNPRKMLRLGLMELQKQGCRTVGVISNMLMQADLTHSAAMDFYRSIVDLANELGMQIRNNWIRFPQEYPPHLAHFGYEQFHALWDLPQRPEGLLVYPDGVATGVITAILERRLNVPQELKLAFHANDLLPYVCPFPATFLLTKVGSFADALIRMIRTQLEGGQVRPVQIPISVVREGMDPFSLTPAG